MPTIVLCGFKPVQRLEQYFRPSVLLKGEKLYATRRVYDVKETDGLVVRARCHSQQGKQLYIVSLLPRKAECNVLEGSCDCRYGMAGNCKHCAAVAVYMNRKEEAPCTFQPQRRHQERRFCISSSTAHNILRSRKTPGNWLTLSRTHRYYTQAQLLMFICNLEECFFIYTEKNNIILLYE
nr:uncharacterized protein LOC119161783 [Rhipicephalus microplus]